MKKLLAFASSALFMSTNIMPLTIKNQAKKPIIVITNYENENFYKVYEQLKPTFLNREPSLKINFKNLKEIQIYDNVPTKYKNGVKINIKKTKALTDINKNTYKKIQKKANTNLPNSLLEIDKNELADKKFGIMLAPQGKLTFVEATKNLKS